ncbi:MAG: cytochrome c maturation protein CcmE [Xanthomonadales bacterium]|nr:cytochrome c maturation protein CcmE [Xanthomonadales bacterium]
MTPTRKRRLYAALAVTIGVGVAVGLTVMALRDNMLFFFSPTEVHAGEVPEGSNFRLGGMVVDGSVTRTPGSLKVRFDLTDHGQTVPVEYEGILPDLFREGQGIIAMGSLNKDSVFVASEVLAKHDETYMPPEVADALKAVHPEGYNSENYGDDKKDTPDGT